MCSKTSCSDTAHLPKPVLCLQGIRGQTGRSPIFSNQAINDTARRGHKKAATLIAALIRVNP